jgi:Outer membrane protein W
MRFGSFVLGLGAVLALTATSVSAAPYEAGTVLLRVRALEVVPDVSSNVNVGGKIDITDVAIPELDVTYFLDPNWSLELIAGTTHHSIHLKGVNGLDKIGSTWLLPPTLTVQYHFDLGRVKPYVGAGINYSLFYDKRGIPALGKLKLTDQWGAAVQAGVDVPLTEDGRYFFNLDLKKIFVSTHASFAASAATANVDVNPWLIGAGVGVRF